MYSPGYYSVFMCSRGYADMQCMVMVGHYYSGAVLFEPPLGCVYVIRVCECVRACVCACVRACECICVHLCVRA